MTQVSPFELFNDTEDTWIWRQYLNNNSVSDRLGSILDKMLERATNRRYSSADDVLKALSSEEESSDPAQTDPESSKKSGLYWTLESLEVYQLQAIYQRIFWTTPPTESKNLTEKIYGFLERFTEQHKKETNVKEEDILSLWITHLLELVNSLSMPQEKMEATKNLILVEISNIKLLKNSQERDEKLEAIAKQLLLLFFEESNAEGVFKDVITKNSEPYQSLLTKKPLKQAAQSNLLEAGTSMLLIAIGIFFTKKFFPNSPVSEGMTVINTKLADAGNSVCEGIPFSNKLFFCNKPTINQTTQMPQNNPVSQFWPLIVLAALLFLIFFFIRYNNRRKKLLFIQTIFSIYSYKFQNGLEKL
jgi:serine/threonine protein kinase